MVLATAAQLVEALHRCPVVEPARLAQLTQVEANRMAYWSARALADDLVGRGWLTPFQADCLVQGDGDELLLGPFTVLDRLGKGGMGQVYKARHQRLGRAVALKVIRPEHEQHPGIAQRFEREARAAASLQHPNVVTIHDVSGTDGTLFIAMELIDGIDLSKLVKQNGPLGVAQACDYARQAALGLQHATERGLVHRDIKPSNLMVTRLEGTTHPFGLLKILDFGLARVVADSAGSETLTPTDQWIGTPDYIAPEQARSSRDVDIRADIYSLGCTLYYLLTGRSPFAGVNRVEKLVARLEHEAPPASHLRPQVPAQLDAVLARMMARVPEARFATPLDVARALEPFSKSTGQPAEGIGERPTVSGGSASADDGPSDRTLGAQEHGLASSPLPSVSPWTPTEAVASPHVALHRKGARRGWFAGAAGLLILAWLTPHLIPWVGAPNGGNPGGGIPAAKPFVNSLGMKLVHIPAGSFIMGSPPGETGHSPDEAPQHRVEIKKAFWMGAHEVTQAEFQEVMGRNPSHFSPLGAGAALIEGVADPGRLPVDSVIWEEALEFCTKLTQRERKEGRTYRLPTEAEWEYACRANTTGPFWLGNRLAADEANFDGRHPYNAPPGGFRQRTLPVGGFAANPFGLYDVHGNVWEWCGDRYRDYAEKIQPGGPNSPDSEPVVRGGAWSLGAADCRSARRIPHDADLRSNFVGFRVVCEP